MSQILSVSEILKTKNYSIFKHIANREISQSHVDVLVRDFKDDENSLYKCPLYVSENLTIVDGQHRLVCAQILKFPVYYRVDYELKTEKQIIEAIQKRNVNQLPWRIRDFIYSKSKGNNDYMFIRNLYEKYKKHISISSIISICKIEGKNSFNSHNKIIKDGLLNILNKDEVTEFLYIFYNSMEKVTASSTYKSLLCNRMYLNELMDLYYNPIERATYNLFFEKINNYFAYLSQVANNSQARTCIIALCHGRKPSTIS